jgi:phosphatidylserine/phosphatidylglycerophosphate/cardiolipin synthase-like enzyme
MAVDGPLAAALGELSRERWTIAGGDPIPRPPKGGDPWPDALEADFRGVDVAIARTRAEHDGREPVREIEALYLDIINGAQRFFYAENQYFASRVLAKAIAQRLAEDDPPEFVIVNPKSGRGWLDDEAMSPARAELFDLVQSADRRRRFRIYTPVTDGGEDIYVHSKITIVDDRWLRVGSANLNNRSLGFDSECDLLVDAALPGNAGAAETIAGLRADLLSEHLGASVDSVAGRLAETGSLIRAIESYSGGRGRGLIPLIPKQPNRAERAFVESELLDPESAGEQFEPIARPGLLAGMGSLRRFRR